MDISQYALYRVIQGILGDVLERIWIYMQCDQWWKTNTGDFISVFMAGMSALNSNFETGGGLTSYRRTKEVTYTCCYHCV